MARNTFVKQSRYMMLLHRNVESSALTPKKDTKVIKNGKRKPRI